MEDQRTEIEFDEFEKLLGEIPNATAANQHSADAGPKIAPLNGNLAHISVNSCKGAFSEKLESNGSLNDRQYLANKTQQSPIKNLQSDEPNLPDDQSLTSAFAELSFNSESPLVNCKSSPNPAVYTNTMNGSLSNMDSTVMVSPPFRSPNNLPSGFDKFNVAKVGQEQSNFLNFDARQLKVPADFCQPQPTEHFPTALPPTHGMRGFQLLSNVAVPGMDFPLMSDHQQYFTDVQSSVPYLHSQHLNQSHISWRNIGEEQYYRFHQQYLYMQQLRNQRLEAQNHVQANGNFATKLTSRKREATIFGGKQSFPEKILTRSQGLNTLKALKFGSAGGNETLAHLNHNGKFLSNGHLLHSLPTPTAGCFQLDHLTSWDISPDFTDLKSYNLRSQSLKYNSADEVTGRIYLMAKDQHGCRFLQRKFCEGTPQDVEKIFLEIIDHFVELMTDPFGNYLVQKLLEVCDEDQRMQILRAITRKAGELVRISCDMHGTRAVQKVIETLKTPEQFSHGCLCIEAWEVLFSMLWSTAFFFEATTANCIELATDRHGCCVLQKCLSHSEGEQRHQLVSEITSNALILSQDPFGNYVVQFVFELRLPWATTDIVDQLEGNYRDLSVQKYSSNVVEKCLKYAGEERRTSIIRELINNAHLDHVMQDPFGNYVIQAALQHSKGALHTALVEAIRPHVPTLRTSPYGKKVLSSNSLKK
ncbi:RNA BINDING PROTEIN PUMILIO-RELATED [Salix viminalis]|uniref:RNA BINDING PROTEIN PUMILIO-RELATED n=1 Tax=Salix viminalis TaxID=40686 RepID=A0A9Q0QA69_SALVM|nr:RNA BINDING PROTEIN PUMILIO-RELATED [Salix viminalis]